MVRGGSGIPPLPGVPRDEGAATLAGRRAGPGVGGKSDLRTLKIFYQVYSMYYDEWSSYHREGHAMAEQASGTGRGALGTPAVMEY